MRTLINKISSITFLFVFLATYLIFAITQNDKTEDSIIYLHKVEDIYRQKKNFLSGQQLLSHLTSSGNVVVMFYEDWCKWCQNMIPIVQKLSLKRSDIKFVKVKRELYREIFRYYNFNTVPALLFFKNGKLMHKEPSSLTYKKSLKLIATLYDKK